MKLCICDKNNKTKNDKGIKTTHQSQPGNRSLKKEEGYNDGKTPNEAKKGNKTKIESQKQQLKESKKLKSKR